jgi:GTP cyclohydrolase I/GTP cyclohydrolase-4
MIGRVLERYRGELAPGDFVHARQVNFETIHNHEVLAERSGTVAELRGELETGEFSGRYRELRDWLQNGA